jgi:hypothetical protein
MATMARYDAALLVDKNWIHETELLYGICDFMDMPR